MSSQRGGQSLHNLERQKQGREDSEQPCAQEENWKQAVDGISDHHGKSGRNVNVLPMALQKVPLIQYSDSISCFNKDNKTNAGYSSLYSNSPRKKIHHNVIEQEHTYVPRKPT